MGLDGEIEKVGLSRLSLPIYKVNALLTVNAVGPIIIGLSNVSLRKSPPAERPSRIPLASGASIYSAVTSLGPTVVTPTISSPGPPLAAATCSGGLLKSSTIFVGAPGSISIPDGELALVVALLYVPAIIKLFPAAANVKSIVVLEPATKLPVPESVSPVTGI